MTKFLIDLWENHTLLAAILAWFVAQVLKVILEGFSQRSVDMKRMVGSGGMPSSHSSFVMALLVMVGKINGVSSTEFAISFVVALVVMYDATGVRRAAGQQAKIINWMIANWDKKENWEPTEDKSNMFEKKLKELLGHTPLEVIAGALLGILVGILMPA